jgi:hypothetical protein
MSSAPNAIINSRAKQQLMLQKMLDGLTKHEQTLPTVAIAGTSYKVADLKATLQARLQAAQAVDATRAIWQNAVKTDHDERAKTKVFVSGLRQALLVAFAGSVENLADFGLVGRKARVVSPEKKGAATAKAQATRAARHTMGKKQRAQIKGVVPTAPHATPPAVPAGASPVTASPPPTAAPTPTVLPQPAAATGVTPSPKS